MLIEDISPYLAVIIADRAIAEKGISAQSDEFFGNFKKFSDLQLDRKQFDDAIKILSDCGVSGDKGNEFSNFQTTCSN